MGAGMWGTTFAQVLCDAGTPVRLWGRRPDLVATINARHENPDYLPGITLPAELTASADADRVLDQRGPRRAGRPRPDAAPSPHGLAGSAARRGGLRQPDEGHRARHP